MSTETKLLTAPLSEVKKTERKRENPPTPPIREKQRVKKSKRIYLSNYSSQSRPRARTRVEEPPRVCSPDEAGRAASFIVTEVLHCSAEKNLRLWAAFCLYNPPEAIIDLAYKYASCFRQGEVQNRVTAFQAKLNKDYPETVAYLVARKKAEGGAR